LKKFWYLLALLGVFTLALSMSNVTKAESQKVTQEESLPTLGTVEKLRSILAEAETSRSVTAYGMGMATSDGAGMRNGIAKSAAPNSAPQAAAEQGLALGGDSNYSTTNLQVDGVDEADIIKNDGNYIYQVNNQEIIVAQVSPSEQMSIMSRIGFKQGEFTPQELYVDDKYLVVIGSAYYPVDLPLNPLQGDNQPNEPDSRSVQPKIGNQAQIYPPMYNKSTTKAIIYDLKDKTELKKIREVELDGNYVTSRKIGSNLYLISNQYLDTYHIMQQQVDPPQPSYRDSVGKEDFVKIGYNDIHYFPNFIEPNYLLVAGLNLDLKDKEMQVSSYLGSSQTVYASSSNLYVAVTQYQQIEQAKPMPQPTPDPATSSIMPRDQLYPNPYKTVTALYKFSLDKGETTYKNKGEVPGTILNQFAMDENNGFFRIATTTGEIWRTDNLTSKNNVYILDEALQVTGKVEDIAPGEKIYSVRFLGDRGYMVTFKNVDPFFVLDLKDPTSPQILGALKIPGFSDYLHPYDDNHIIGFGKETVELNQNGITNAYYQGLKLAVFDVTDVSHPVEMFKTIIGDRGTDSEVLRNHKSLLFDKEKGILSFPVTLMEVKNANTNYMNGILDYGQFSFQGAYVYQFDLVEGFTLRGKITHLKDTDLLKAGQHYNYGFNTVERIIQIKDTLYTVSKQMIKANDLISLNEKNSLNLKP